MKMNNNMLDIENEMNTDTYNNNKVHIRIQQRTGRKNITSIQGLENDLDLKKIVRAFKKTFRCNGAIIDHKEYGEIIQLQGDHRESISEFLIDYEIVSKEQIIIHGF